MAHDLSAELAGYRNELAQVRDDSHETQVRAEIRRVTAAIRRQAQALEDQANGLADGEQDIPAAHARMQARALRAALGDESDDAADTTPRETAVTRQQKRERP